MVKRLVECPADCRRENLRTIVFGGAPMYVEDIKKALDRFGAHLAQIYGQGESPMTITTLSRQEIAKAVGVSKNYLTQIFHQELDISPWEYLTRYRIKEAKELLHSTDASIAYIAARVGFDDASYFGRVFRKQVGCSPLTYRDQKV